MDVALDALKKRGNLKSAIDAMDGELGWVSRVCVEIGWLILYCISVK